MVRKFYKSFRKPIHRFSTHSLTHLIKARITSILVSLLSKLPRPTATTNSKTMEMMDRIAIIIKCKGNILNFRVTVVIALIVIQVT